MSRAAHGQGSVYFDTDKDRWVGQASAGFNPSTGKRRRLKVVGGPGESRKSVAARLADRIATDTPLTQPATVGALLEDWFARAAPKRKSPGWLATSRQLVNTHVMPGLGQVPIEDVTVELVEEWMSDLAGRLSRSTVVKVRSQLALAFDYGLRRRVVDWNPARIAELPASNGRPREGRALTGTEARSLLNVAAGHRLGAWVTTTLTLGLRPGEASGLSWPDIDLDAGVVIIHRALAWDDRQQPYLKPTKTKRPRTLELPPRTFDALRDHRKRQVEERLLMGGRWPAQWSDLVFVSENGTPLNPSNLRRLVSTLAVAAGIDGKVTPYDLRHSATSLLSASGVAPELLADLLGHVDTRMVHRHYRHPVTPSIRVARDRIEEALGL